MSDRNPVPAREADLQQAFDRQAGSLGLRLEPAPGSGAVRSIGEAFFFGTTEDYDVPEAPPAVGAADDAEIQTLLNEAFVLTPQQLAADWRDYYADPFQAVGESWTTRMDDKKIKKWLKSPELAQWLQDFPIFTPRQVLLSNITILYLGNVRAVVTYHVQETYQNATVAAGNGAAIVIKLDGLGWRILVITKMDRSLP
ncbi:MAG TPA: hypothetical protein VF789_21485 [Thermoanaerobaculia bacterium]